MPYIPQSAREIFDEHIIDIDPTTPGELNYVITKLCVNYLKNKLQHNYKSLNEIIGVLECSKQEFYRMIVAPYEDEKMRENGPVI